MSRFTKSLFTAVYEEFPPEQGGGFTGYLKEFPGAISEGDTLDEARENLLDALRTLLTVS